MVRLKRGIFSRPRGKTGFQFHYGSIKTSEAGIPRDRLFYFNSTMVRLKRSGIVACCQFVLDFNSTMVRLKLNSESLFPGMYGYFNSTMVRLKPRSIQSYFHAGLLFQFHYGSIKTAPNTTPPVLPRGISIPLWFD